MKNTELFFFVSIKRRKNNENNWNSNQHHLIFMQPCMYSIVSTSVYIFVGLCTEELPSEEKTGKV